MRPGFVSRGFRGRRVDTPVASRLPPGQHLTRDFPVLSAGPTPRTPLQKWDFTVNGLVVHPQRWTWEQLLALPKETVKADIHCVTKWSKLDTNWEGVSLETLLEAADPTGDFLIAHCDGDYTTNLSLDDVTGGRAWVAYRYPSAFELGSGGGIEPPTFSSVPGTGEQVSPCARTPA